MDRRPIMTTPDGLLIHEQPGVGLVASAAEHNLKLSEWESERAKLVSTRIPVTTTMPEADKKVIVCEHYRNGEEADLLGKVERLEREIARLREAAMGCLPLAHGDADEPKEQPEQIGDEVMRLRREKAQLREALQSLVDWGDTLPDIASEKQRAEYDADYERATSVLSASAQPPSSAMRGRRILP